MNVKGKLAVITGAGGGIGRAIAISLAKRGCDLALADINEIGIAETAREAQALGVKTSCHRLDVASREQVAALPAAVMAAHGRVDIVVNNAGVALGGMFEQVSEADFDWLMEINFNGVVRMTRAFLPLLRQSPQARLVNISSIFGIVSVAGQTAYSASKFAVRGFSNALRCELEGTNVGVTVVHPGGVATSIAKSARVSDKISSAEVEKNKKRAERMLRMTPAMAGEIIVRGIEAEKARLIVGGDAKFSALLERLMPVSYWNILKKGFRA